MKIAVIGGGAGGMFCSGGLAKAGHDVVLFEKNEKLGKKLYITGKGRCNLTNLCDKREFIDNVVTNSKFLMSAVYGFTPRDCVDFFENIGLQTKTERGNRVFPASDKSSDVIKCLQKYDEQNGVKIRLCCKVLSVSKANESFCVETSQGKEIFDAVVLATGGVTYSSTGSTGDGYAFAKALGHKVTNIRPALVPFILSEKTGLEGLSLKNVRLSVYTQGKERFCEFGEMLFTHDGVSGPLVLSASSVTGKYCDNQNRFCKDSKIMIDLKPALDEETLDNRILREIDNAKNCEYKSLLATLMPKSLVPFVCRQSGVSENAKLNSLTKEQRKATIHAIKGLSFGLVSLDKTDFGIVTQGGVDVGGVNPKDMQSKIVTGLYFTGEILDVDAFTGGFNLHIAFATANCIVRALS